jgi:hypothetical protein
MWSQNDMMTATTSLDTVKSVLAVNGTVGFQSVAVGVSSSVSLRHVHFLFAVIFSLWYMMHACLCAFSEVNCSNEMLVTLSIVAFR